MLRVLLLLPLSRLGHVWRKPCNGMHDAQTRPWFILSPKEYGGESEPMITPCKKIPQPDCREEGRSRDVASRLVASPTHYQLSYSGPTLSHTWNGRKQKQKSLGIHTDRQTDRQTDQLRTTGFISLPRPAPLAHFVQMTPCNVTRGTNVLDTWEQLDRHLYRISGFRSPADLVSLPFCLRQGHYKNNIQLICSHD